MAALHHTQDGYSENLGGLTPPQIQTAKTPSNIRLMTSQELAEELRFAGVNSAFRKFCHAADIRPVPGRRDCYDPIAVRFKLDRMQGLEQSAEANGDSALTRSRMRRHG